MTQQINTAMRDAFENIIVKRDVQLTAVPTMILSALKRKVGVKKRHAMWSVQRGNGKG